jgi:hypothetical protein
VCVWKRERERVCVFQRAREDEFWRSSQMAIAVFDERCDAAPKFLIQKTSSFLWSIVKIWLSSHNFKFKFDKFCFCEKKKKSSLFKIVYFFEKALNIKKITEWKSAKFVSCISLINKVWRLFKNYYFIILIENLWFN